MAITRTKGDTTKIDKEVISKLVCKNKIAAMVVVNAKAWDQRWVNESLKVVATKVATTTIALLTLPGARLKMRWFLS